MSNEKSTEALLAEIADLKQQLEAKNAVNTQYDSLRSEIMDSVPVLLAFVDTDLRYVFANRTYQSWFSLDQKKLVGRSVEDVVGPEAFANIKPQLLNALKGKSFTFETQVPVADGSLRDIAASYVPRCNVIGLVEGIFVIVSDITDVARMTRELERANRIQALGQLTGGVAHDFNNLLAIIQGNIDLLKLNTENAQSLKSIDAIASATKNGATLTSRLLSFARNQQLSPEVLNVGKKLEGLREVLTISLGACNQLNIEVGDTAAIAVDVAQFENALINLAVNARDAMPGGGSLTISQKQESVSEADSVHLGKIPAGDYVVITVSDNGEGIDSDKLGRVFEPFYTSKEQGKGTGLGLSMVYGFAKQSGGHVLINSTLGQGTDVVLYFPLSKELSSSNTAAEPSVLKKGREKILVVEDNDDLRHVAVAILEKQDYQITAVANGADALAKLNNDPDFDLLFSDIMLPGGMSGVDVAKQALSLQPKIKILYTSGYANGQLTDSETLAGRAPLVAKPYCARTLLETLRSVLD